MNRQLTIEVIFWILLFIQYYLTFENAGKLPFPVTVIGVIND